MGYTIQIKRATAARWLSLDPVLLAGEPGVEKDTGKLKIGDGTNLWSVLAYLAGEGGGGDGTVWFSGTTAPDNGTGAEGDFYLNTATGEIYKKGVSTWGSVLMTIIGADGAPGNDGNGIASVVKTSTVGLVDTYTITFDDATTTDFDVANGSDGAPGVDGVTPVKDVDYFDGVDGYTPIKDVDYFDGSPGADGDPGVGVPEGGTSGQILAKIDGTDYNTEWKDPPSGGASDAADISIEDVAENFTATDVEGALAELFTNVSDGKDLIATAITDKGVSADGSDTFTVLSEKIGSIEGGGGESTILLGWDSYNPPVITIGVDDFIIGVVSAI